MPAERRTPDRPHVKARKGPGAARRPKRLSRKQRARGAAQNLIVIPQLVPQSPIRAPKRTASAAYLPPRFEGKRHKSNRISCAPHLGRLEEYARARAILQQYKTRPRPRAVPHRPSRPYSRTKETREARRFKRKVENLRRNGIERRESRITVWTPTAVSLPTVLDVDMICVTSPATPLYLDAHMGLPESEPSCTSDAMDVYVDGATAPTQATQVLNNHLANVTSSTWSSDRPPTEEGSSTQRRHMKLDVLEDTHMSEAFVSVVVAEKAIPPAPATLSIGITKGSQGGTTTREPATYTAPIAAAPSTTPCHRPSPLRTCTTEPTVAVEAWHAQQAPAQNSATSAPNALPVLPENSGIAPRKVNGLLRSALSRAAWLKLTPPTSVSPNPLSTNAVASSSASAPSVAASAPVHIPQQGPASTRASGSGSSGRQASARIEGTPGSNELPRPKATVEPPTPSIGRTDYKGKGKASATHRTPVTKLMAEAESQVSLEEFAVPSSSTSQVHAPQPLIGTIPSYAKAQETATRSPQADPCPGPTSTVTATVTATDKRPAPGSTSGTQPAPVQGIDVSAQKTRRLPRSAIDRLVSSSAPPALASTSAAPPGSQASGSCALRYNRSPAPIEGPSGSAESSRPRAVGGASTPSPTERVDHKGKGKASEHLKHLAEWGLDVDDEEEETHTNRRAFHASMRNVKGARGGLMRNRL